jgi:hypothetical protein
MQTNKFPLIAGNYTVEFEDISRNPIFTTGISATITVSSSQQAQYEALMQNQQLIKLTFEEDEKTILKKSYAMLCKVTAIQPSATEMEAIDITLSPAS